jgi:hypothetical protein
MRMSNLRNLLLCLLATLAIGCQSREGRDSEGILGQLERLLRHTTERVQGMTPSTDEVTAAAQKEFSNLFILEYRVVEVDNGASPEKLQEMLTQLGKDRWECFNILERGASYMIPCRRRPESLLRYVLRFVPWP